jgi:hypothetical protein
MKKINGWPRDYLNTAVYSLPKMADDVTLEDVVRFLAIRGLQEIHVAQTFEPLFSLIPSGDLEHPEKWTYESDDNASYRGTTEEQDTPTQEPAQPSSSADSTVSTSASETTVCPAPSAPTKSGGHHYRPMSPYIPGGGDTCFDDYQ